MWSLRVRKEEIPDGQEETPNCCVSAMHDVNVAWQGTKDEYVQFYDELKDECTPSIKPPKYYQELVQNTLKEWIHIPYFPAFHRPGWLLRYLLGPFDSEWVSLFVAGNSLDDTILFIETTNLSRICNSFHTILLLLSFVFIGHRSHLISIYFFFFFSFFFVVLDFCAGLTVAFTLIPQALSYAALANLPPINGLYTAILPSTCYVFFGSSMQLAVGPVAVVSLMTGTLITQYQPDYATNTIAAVDTAAQAAFNVGILMTVMGILNLGSFIHFISHPVMSGFTTGAAMSIGLSQLNNAFGFSSSTAPYAAPKQGQPGYEYNYKVMQWIITYFNEKYNFQKSNKSAALYNGKTLTNPYAMKVQYKLLLLQKKWIFMCLNLCLH